MAASRTPRLAGLIRQVAFEGRLFHWPLAFPEVFAAGGFDVILGNPPFLGGLKISTEFGDKYWHYLTVAFAPTSAQPICVRCFSGGCSTH